MMETIKERWMKLCNQARQEQDTEKLIQLVEEINNLLELQQREKQERTNPAQATADQAIPDHRNG